ncbi:MAG: hypothetical protein A2381_09340 [Bdellovibrionales bacterium RIFOXYB1_FULL_37_110]|nr:MAG: hypothetical protein A2417_14380 [Bdellovibrionales bacterium RIFOXYC1_FULL_37_79]OFZ56881.1 MAG: hypothetical protein A2381_09340 [Bdellovibrionales bacterium RIFOXYB1_FULL_37_110]OFZ65567.1 MAG: hypothetical protein A2577_17295 [Bdellovibrionales bacterium RIFOXYD1_FULL_36_51]
MDDPIIGVRARVNNQSDASINFDLFVDISPKGQKDKQATVNTEGNAARGGNAALIGAEIGKKDKGTQWKIKFELGAYGKAEGYNAETGLKKSESDSYSTLDINFTWQWSWPIFSLDLTGGIGSEGKVSGSDVSGATPVSIEEAAHSVVNLGVKLAWTLIPDKLNINWDIYGIGHADHDYQSGTDTLQIKDEAEGSSALGLSYQF